MSSTTFLSNIKLHGTDSGSTGQAKMGGFHLVADDDINLDSSTNVLGGVLKPGGFQMTASSGATLFLKRSAGDVNTDDVIGKLSYHVDYSESGSFDGGEEQVGFIEVSAEANYGSAGTNSRPTKMEFGVSGNSSQTAVTVLTLNGSDKSADFEGPVNFNNNNRVGDGKSIRFGAAESNGNDASSIGFNASTSKLEITADEASNNEIELTGIVRVNGELNFKKSGFTSITASSNSHAVDFATNTNNYNVTATNATNTITFSNLSSSVIGKSGSIIITNPSSVGSLAFAALPNTAYTPGGSTISFDTTANAIAVISYLVIASNKVLVNYVGAFKQYGT